MCLHVGKNTSQSSKAGLCCTDFGINPKWRVPADVASQVEHKTEAAAQALLRMFLDRASLAKVICLYLPPSYEILEQFKVKAWGWLNFVIDRCGFSLLITCTVMFGGCTIMHPLPGIDIGLSKKEMNGDLCHRCNQNFWIPQRALFAEVACERQQDVMR